MHQTVKKWRKAQAANSLIDDKKHWLGKALRTTQLHGKDKFARRFGDA
jgi:hypothetical protein